MTLERQCWKPGRVFSASAGPNWSDVEARIIREYEDALGVRNLEQWIEDAANELSILGSNGNPCVRLNADVLRARRVRTVCADTKFSGLARLVPESGSFRIEINRKLAASSTCDRRFWIAHELSHTFLLKRDGLTPLSETKRLTGLITVDEWICDRLAAAILVPRWLIEDFWGSALAQEVSQRFFQLGRWAELFVVPERLLARRLLHDVLIRQDLMIRVKVQSQRNAGHLIRWAALPPHFSSDDRKRLERAVLPRTLLPEVGHGEIATSVNSLTLQSWLKCKLCLPTDDGVSFRYDSPHGQWGKHSDAVYGLLPVRISPRQTIGGSPSEVAPDESQLPTTLFGVP